MKKFTQYSIFILGSLFVIILFITANTYLQLALAVVLYPVLAYFALEIFPRKKKITQPIVMPAYAPVAPPQEVSVQKENTSDDVDIDRRTFLKLIGATGIFFFLSSLAGKWSALPFGKALQPAGFSSSPSDGASIAQTGSSPLAGFQIAEIDEGIITYYGFTQANGSWLIMKEDTDTNSFRYAKGKSGFPDNWAKHQNLKYDYYSNLI